MSTPIETLKSSAATLTSSIEEGAQEDNRNRPLKIIQKISCHVSLEE